MEQTIQILDELIQEAYDLLPDNLCATAIDEYIHCAIDIGNEDPDTLAWLVELFEAAVKDDKEWFNRAMYEGELS